jgi:hypothetical protein
MFFVCGIGVFLLLLSQPVFAGNNFKKPFAEKERNAAYPENKFSNSSSFSPGRTEGISTRGLDPPDDADDDNRIGAATGDAFWILTGGTLIYGFYLLGKKQKNYRRIKN